jgi:hypothetical protein
MNKKFGGVFMAITLIVGAIAFPLAEIGTHTAFAEVGVDVNAGVKVKVGSDNDTASANTEAKAKMGSESETNSEKIKIEVSVSNGKSTIKIESNGDEKTFVLDSTSKTDIIAKIQSETSLSESEITSIWQFNEESNAYAETSSKSKADLDAEVDAKISVLTNASEKAKTKSRLLLDSIKGNLQKTDKRAYTIMLKAQANGYLDAESHGKPSYIITLSGTAQSKTKADATMEGSVYLDLIKNNTNVAKYTVSGGKLVIDNQNYDVLFGKVRETSLNSESGSSMILIAEVMKPDGDITAMKILLESSTSANHQTDSSWTILNPQSHIAGTWKLDAKGNMSMA